MYITNHCGSRGARACDGRSVSDGVLEKTRRIVLWRANGFRVIIEIKVEFNLSFAVSDAAWISAYRNNSTQWRLQLQLNMISHFVREFETLLLLLLVRAGGVLCIFWCGLI